MVNYWFLSSLVGQQLTIRRVRRAPILSLSRVQASKLVSAFHGELAFIFWGFNFLGLSKCFKT